ncbi:response regulator [Zhongshania sp.]|uniref:response regulator n=1 Tax=Zhongshania sp. TaxID=1971902 RepID=UPI003564AF1B
MKRILIAEDEPHIFRVIRIALERAGYDVEHARNGEEALAKLKIQFPDALITDIAMPKMDGRELCRRIEEEIPDRQFPIIISTSKTDIEHREWSGKMQNLTFLEKPASLRQLIALLAELLDSSKGTQRGHL